MVTKRLPLSSPEGFVSKRVFRLGNCSFGLAVWFGLLETYSESPALLTSEASMFIQQGFEARADLKQVYLWMVNPVGFPARARLSVWNCKEGISLLQDMLQIVLKGSAADLGYGHASIVALCRELGIILREAPSKEATKGNVTLYVRHTVEGAELMYENYAREDFYAFNCGCIYVKVTLHYELLKIAQNRTISSQECANLVPQCVHQTPIGAKLYEFAFCEAQEGSSEIGHTVCSRMLLSEPDVKPVDDTICCFICHESSLDLRCFCLWNCKLCENCWVIHYYSAGFAWCPKCYKPLAERGLQDIRKLLVRYSSLPGIAPRRTCEKFLYCGKCKEHRGMESAHIHTDMAHSCQVCDTCWYTLIVEKGRITCPLCKLQLNATELDRIRACFRPKKPQAEERKESAGLFYRNICSCTFQSAELAHCQHLDTVAMAWVVNGHAYCVECLPSDLHCQRCHTYPNLQCTGCGRTVTFEPNRERDTVEGLCKAGCVLCICCIYSASKMLGRYKCGVCMKKCKCLHPNSFKSSRKAESRGCCEKNVRERLILHGCGSYVHPNCKLCKQCNQSIAETPELSRQISSTSH